MFSPTIRMGMKFLKGASVILEKKDLKKKNEF